METLDRLIESAQVNRNELVAQKKVLQDRVRMLAAVLEGAINNEY